VADEPDKWDLPSSPTDAGGQQNGAGTSCGWKKVVRGDTTEDDVVLGAWRRTRQEEAGVKCSSGLDGGFGGEHNGNDDDSGHDSGPQQRNETSGVALFCHNKFCSCRYLSTCAPLSLLSFAATEWNLE